MDKQRADTKVGPFYLLLDRHDKINLLACHIVILIRFSHFIFFGSGVIHQSLKSFHGPQHVGKRVLDREYSRHTHLFFQDHYFVFLL